MTGRIPRSTSLPTALVFLLLALFAAPAAAQEKGEPTETSKDQQEKLAQNLPPTDPAPKEAVRALRSKIDGILKKRVSSKAKVGIYAVDTTTGQVLYAKNASEGFNPASNIKLLTAAAALDAFQPHRTFATRLIARPPNAEGIVDGPLYVVGEGEAFLLFEDIIDWAAKLKLKGVETIKEGIVIDDAAFKGEYLPPGFDQKDEDASYRSPIGAVSVNFNAVTVIVEPADKAGREPEVRFFPPNDHLTLVNKARTVDSSGQSVRFSSDPDGNGGTTITVGGAIGTRSSAVRDRLRIDNPPKFAGSVLREALEMVDIDVQGEVKHGQAPGDGEKDSEKDSEKDGARTEVLVNHYSQPLSYVVLAMNKWSNNFMAEQLLRTLGRGDDQPSTWERSRERVLDFLKTAGVDTSELTLKNGSGLYDGNSVAPRHFVRLLTHMLDHRAGPEFVTSLAVAGRDGTLRGRMKGAATAGNVRAKTGTLNDVSALSGYLDTQSGRRVAFSVLFNETPKRAWLYRPVQDDIVEALAEFGE